MPTLFSETTSPVPLDLVRQCTSINSFKKARQLHALILTSATVSFISPFIHNNILSMYARCGALGESQLVFEKMPHRNIVSFNALIASYSRVSDSAVMAIQLYMRMRNGFLSPTSLTFTSLLQASSLLEDRWMGCSYHAQAVKFGFLQDLCVQTSLLGMYSNCGDLGSAEKVFKGIVYRDAVAWNSLILGHLKNGKIIEGLDVFGGMVKVGVVPTPFTYSMMLSACSKLKDDHLGQRIHAQVIVNSMLDDLPLENALIDMYCSCGDTQTAFRIFKGLDCPDLVSWNSVISGFAEIEDGNNAMEVFIQLRELSFPKPDEYTYAAILSATCAFSASHYGKPLHAQVTKAGYERSVFVGSTLVSMYFKNDETEAVQKVFNSIPEKDVILWTEMITIYSKMTCGDKAIKCYTDMWHQCQQVDGHALSGALNACADLALLKQGEMIHSQAVKMGYEFEMSVCGSLVDMYSKNGFLDGARSIFSLVPVPDLKCWNTMLGGYSHHGRVEEAFKLFEEILARDINPDQVTFLTLLSACSHSRQVEKGRFFWKYMKEIGLVPGPKHYSCMINLLSRAGLLEEAEDMINRSPYFEESMEMWRTLLSSCVIKKNLIVGVHAAEEVLRVNPEDGATLILLSNLYAAEQRWDKVSDIRNKIRGMMIEKDPGLSWIETKNDIHVFSSGDQLHRNVNEVQTELHRLQQNMVRKETCANEVPL